MIRAVARTIELVKQVFFWTTEEVFFRLPRHELQLLSPSPSPPELESPPGCPEGLGPYLFAVVVLDHVGRVQIGGVLQKLPLVISGTN